MGFKHLIRQLRNWTTLTGTTLLMFIVQYVLLILVASCEAQRNSVVNKKRIKQCLYYSAQKEIEKDCACSYLIN